MARISRTFARPRHIARAPPASGPRPKLSLEDVELLSKKMQEAYGWDGPPKPFQLAGIQAQLEGHDIIIQASTGAGKTAVAAGPHLWPSSAGKTTIMVCPLLSLEEEMVRTFDLEFGLKAVAVNSKNGACSPLVLRRILSGVYHIVLISPEMLQSRMFVKKVLRNSKFTRRILSVIVDEAHCISHWGADFRKKYGTLGIIRAFLPRGTPVIALSATLTPRVRRDVTSKLHFPKGGGSFLNIGNDRPNISLVVRACEHPMNSYTDLDFVIPANISSPADVPKTYIYADNINTGTEITEYLVALLRSRTDTSDADAEAAVRPFNATMSHSYRTDAMEAFRSGSVRILVCTDAAGMGCNISDVDIVVQWKLPLTLSNFVQRAGRAARSPSRIGLAVLLVEPSVYSSQDPTQPRTSRSRRKRGKGAMKTQDGAESQEASTRATAQDTKTRRSEARLYAEAHGLKQGSSTGLHDAAPTAPEQPRLDPDAVDEGLLTFVQSIKCRRKVWAAVYETADVITDSSTAPTVPCCDICHPALFDRTRPASTSRAASTKAPRRGQPAVEFQPRLEAWREAVYARDHHGAQFDHTAILDDGLIDQLTSVGPVSRPKLARILQSSWVWWDEYGDELAVLMEPWVIPFIPKAKKGAASPEEVRNDAGVGSAPPSKRPAKAAPSTQRAPKRPCYETPQGVYYAALLSTGH
ncbi:P-loop containing nucleoside triphosphate hydrolase protein [Cerioporus squamosus]|nr:P-loop containing nucleoside triphosphate hydrolase protein [Cerioporus squamosus]